ncbi:hypothetical protein DERF_006353 [Dermatophagoides farinae]|uniref:RING-type E3 ubiquitin transferase n=1 Tax=Dermatophagoides farinae TaxID=6954 RepID=A0A922L9K9_DERFA|nr:hypothetical protein DERF_006353 [Dermatophagoides farinae]
MNRQQQQQQKMNIDNNSNNNGQRHELNENSRQISQQQQQQQQPDNCCICFGNIINKAIVYDCHHTFCWDCIQEWTRMRHKKCPLCRRWIHFIQYNIRSTNDYDLKQIVHELQDHLLFFSHHQNHHHHHY